MARVHQLQSLLLAAFALLVCRLAQLQALRGAYYRQLAEHNRMRVIPDPAPRGLLVDRRGRVLADNRTVFRLAVVPQELGESQAVFARVSDVVHRPADALRREFLKARSLAFVPATVVAQMPREVALRVEEMRWRMPGVVVQAEAVRHYPHGASAGPLLGHLSEPTAEEFETLRSYGVRPKQLIGRSGLERFLDEPLRGRAGGLVVEVNSRGRQVRVIGRRDPQPGARVTLTLDAPLQSLIERAFEDQPGAAVVLDPSTGEVLAMVSMPSFNPEAFIASDTRAVRQFLEDPASPLMNRAAMGVYQPGSIAKLVTAGAALESHVVTPATGVVCTGAVTIGDRAFHCWNHDGHGPMTLPEALMQSCNVYFMQVGRKVGLVRLRDAMERMGLSHPTGWSLEEAGGHLPHRRLSEGEVALLAIGQGELLLTPLQAAVMAGAFANEGWLVQPWVVRDVAGHPRHPGTRRRLGWLPTTLHAVRQGMIAVVRDPQGTGHRAFTEAVTIAGKTGTAQTHLPGRTHGWFVGFCPVERPKVAMAIVTEHGGSGGDLPAEIAKSVCEYVSAPETL